MPSHKKKVIGVVENIRVVGMRGRANVKAKLDTGSDRSSIDLKTGAKVGLGPVTKTIKTRSSSSKGAARRALVQATILIANTAFDIPVSLVDRQGLKYPVLIGMDILKRGDFLIDPSKT